MNGVTVYHRALADNGYALFRETCNLERVGVGREDEGLPRSLHLADLRRDREPHAYGAYQGTAGSGKSSLPVSRAVSSVT